MPVPPDITDAVAQVNELNRLAWELRVGYLKHHPDAPHGPWEREVERLLRIAKEHGTAPDGQPSR